MPLYQVDVHEDGETPRFARYFLRSASRDQAQEAMEALLIGVGRIKIEDAPTMAETMMEGVEDDMPVMIADYEEKFLG